MSRNALAVLVALAACTPPATTPTATTTPAPVVVPPAPPPAPVKKPPPVTCVTCAPPGCPACLPGTTVERALILTSPAGSGGVLGILTIFDPKLKFRWAHDGAGIAASFDSLGRPAMVAIVTRRQPVDTFGFVTGPMNDTPYGYTFQLQAVAMDSLHKYAPAPTTGVYLTLGVPHLVTVP